MKKKAVVLLSGGLDSSTVLPYAISQGYEVHALSFDYGQKHKFELDAANRIAKANSVQKHTLMTIDLRSFGGSALTADIEVPKDQSGAVQSTEIPITYVPARNTIFLSFALALAEVSGAFDIFIGVNAVDYSGYPDCREEYISSFQKMANLATKKAVEGDLVKIHTPLIKLSKKEIILKGIELGVDYSLTISCYQVSSEGLACGKCDSCRLRKAGFKNAGLPDPTKYL